MINFCVFIHPNIVSAKLSPADCVRMQKKIIAIRRVPFINPLRQKPTLLLKHLFTKNVTKFWKLKFCRRYDFLELIQSYTNMFWFWRKDKTKKNLGFGRKNYRITREPFLYALWEVILNKARPRLSCMCLTKVLVEHFVLCFIPIDSFTVRLQTFSRHHHHAENVTAYFCANVWISFESCKSDIWQRYGRPFMMIFLSYRAKILQ